MDVLLSDLTASIEHTLLRADVQTSELVALCQEAVQWNFAGVCVHSMHVAQCVQYLLGTHIKIITVVGFPLGAVVSSAKAFEANMAAQLGAGEIDMVLPIGAVKEHAWDVVQHDIAAVVQAVACPVKVILETSYLTNDEIVAACTCAMRAGAAFVKTSTGFSAAGASVAHVALMRHTVGATMGVKASGGIRTLAAARAMLQAGANRLGTSHSVPIVQELYEK